MTINVDVQDDDGDKLELAPFWDGRVFGLYLVIENPFWPRKRE